MTAAEVKYVRNRAGYTWADCKTNTEIVKEISVTPVLDKIQEERRNCLQHINRIPSNSLPRIVKNYRPKAEETRGDHYRYF
jgi:type IV secretory pathway component VirB8